MTGILYQTTTEVFVSLVAFSLRISVLVEAALPLTFTPTSTHSFGFLRKLSQNSITRIEEGTFDPIESLKQLDLSGNPLVCDCQLSWLLVWAVNTSVKLSPPARCGSPPPLRGQPLRKLQYSDLHCDWPVSALLELIPNVNQVVFVGDELHLLCRASAAALSENTDPSVSWLWGSSDPTLHLQGVRVENRFWADSGLVE
ncbi:unnamed protein product, partial [Timema podura]|nr:unnamed protein product [Timema podura]